jgi:hypothetical protein
MIPSKCPKTSSIALKNFVKQCSSVSGGAEHGHCSQLCLQWWRAAGVFAGENIRTREEY